MKIYLVGGAVRDELMGLPINDKDYVVVGASEQQMIEIGYKKVGADFPVFMNSDGDQFALARKERKTGRGYLGFETTFDPTVTLEDDLLRRDLTVNAIAKDVETGQLIDPFDGISDLRRGILRHVSDAFAEDPLRVIRLARFYARWPEFEVAFPTRCVSHDLVVGGELNDLADERLYAEMEKMFQQSDRPSRFFGALYVFDALPNVKFFKDLLGENLYNADVKKAADCVKRLPQDAQMASFVALVGESAAQTSSAIPAYTKKLTSAFKELRKTQPTADSVFKLLAFTRGFDESSSLTNDMIRVLSAAEGAGFTFGVESQVLGAATLVARSVTAEKFMHLKGPEIGKAMNTERLEYLRNVIGA